MSSSPDVIRIANCGGFWGDDPTAARRQVAGGPVDYLVMDYLAEITMAILQKQRSKDPSAGYAKDFVVQLRDVLSDVVAKGITVITNAGGVNAQACAEAVTKLAEELGVAEGVRIAVVGGDDLFERLDTLIAAGEPMASLDSGEPLGEVRERVLSANVYLGAAPIVRALEAGANIIIAGRVTDTSVTLAPMIHRFGWSPSDWDKLAAGVVAGHIIECGTQCTGGNHTDWESVPSFHQMGYPIIEASADASFIVTKHPGTGGLVTVDTVREQLLYEMGAPGYLSPDVTARFDSIQLSQAGPDRVQVTGIRGEAPPEKLKVAISYKDGYRAVGRMLVSGPDVLRKAQQAADVFWDLAGGKEHYDHAATQFVGWDASHPPLATEQPSELLMQIAVRDQDRSKIETSFSPMVVGSMLQSMPGMTMPADQGRPRAAEVIAHWAALIPRSSVTATVSVAGRSESIGCDIPDGPSVPFAPAAVPDSDVALDGPEITVPLIRLCLARSGDKGDTANLGVAARSRAIYGWLVEHLTDDVVRQHFKGFVQGPVERHELPNLLAINFLLHASLGGGGTSSLRFDAQGKTYAQYLLALEVTVPTALLATVGT